MSVRLSAALLAGRAVAILSRRLGRGGGTVLPGHIVQRIAPSALREITARLPQGSVLVSGTNGKTTTTRMLTHILAGAGLTSLHNRAGANLMTGLVSSVVERAALNGSPQADIGVFEVDEATLPLALQHISPRAVVLTNLFRDQLDRYGEVAYLAKLWRSALASLPAEGRLVLNADDPQVAALGSDPSVTTFFGVETRTLGSASLPHTADARLCPRCSNELRYTWAYYGHLGDYACAHCGFARPPTDVSAATCQMEGDRGLSARLRMAGTELSIDLPVPGLFNLYNALAATAAALHLGIEPALIARQLASFHAVFGRLERVSADGRHLLVALVKNPVGFNEVLSTILAQPGEKNLVFFINDRLADGTDVSWLWDVDLETLAGRARFAIASGLRAEDMAVRLKYASVDPDRIVVLPDPAAALAAAIQRTPAGQTLYLLPTYTAMLELRELLRRSGYVGGFWED